MVLTRSAMVCSSCGDQKLQCEFYKRGKVCKACKRTSGLKYYYNNRVSCLRQNRQYQIENRCKVKNKETFVLSKVHKTSLQYGLRVSSKTSSFLAIAFCVEGKAKERDNACAARVHAERAQSVLGRPVCVWKACRGKTTESGRWTILCLVLPLTLPTKCNSNVVFITQTFSHCLP